MSDSGALPTFVIIGAMKCGTSSLHYYLNQHPDVSMSMPKELNYFLSNIEGRRDLQLAGRNFEQGVDWYKSHFDPRCAARGESSPAYMDPRHRHVANRMADLVPNATLIVLTRDPFERALSEFRHRVATGEESRPLAEAVLDPTSPYVFLGKYHACLEPFYELFGPGQLIRYRQEDLDQSTPEVVASVLTALGVDSSVQLAGLEKRINTAAGRGTLNRLLASGKGSPFRARVAQFVPNSWKYRLDALSRQATKSAATSQSASDSLDGVREAFTLLLGDDTAALHEDVRSGRLVEGFAITE
jgi:hypothetical protein